AGVGRALAGAAHAGPGRILREARAVRGACDVALRLFDMGEARDRRAVGARCVALARDLFARAARRRAAVPVRGATRVVVVHADGLDHADHDVAAVVPVRVGNLARVAGGEKSVGVEITARADLAEVYRPGVLGVATHHLDARDVRACPQGGQYLRRRLD